MVRKLSIIFCLVALASPALAQQATFRDSLLDHLVGRWILTGTIAGQQTTHDVSAAWVLNHQYVEIHEVSREKGKDGAPEYEATAYIGWDQPSSQYVCVWLDDGGGISSQSLGHAPRNGDSIPLVFPDSSDGGKMHTTFAYKEVDDSWALNVDQETAGKLSPFARTTLIRAK